MDAVARIEQYLSRNPTEPSSQVLAQLTLALDRDEDFALSKLYGMNWEAFELALALLAEWRIDRYFARDAGLLDRVKRALPAPPEPQALAA